MKVLLIEKVVGLGDPGQVVSVSPGYYRNYLFPRKLALEASPGAMKSWEQKKHHRETATQKASQEATALAEKLDGVSITLARKVSEDEHLYGSVTAADIVEALKSEGFEVDKKHLDMKPIKTLGVFDIPVRLHPDAQATIKAWVVQEEE